MALLVQPATATAAAGSPVGWATAAARPGCCVPGLALSISGVVAMAMIGSDVLVLAGAATFGPGSASSRTRRSA